MNINSPAGIDPVVSAALAELDEQAAGRTDHLDEILTGKDDLRATVDEAVARLDRTDLGDAERALLAQPNIRNRILYDALSSADATSLGDADTLAAQVRRLVRDAWIPELKTMVVNRAVASPDLPHRDQILAEARAHDLPIRSGRLQEQLRQWATAPSGTGRTSASGRGSGVGAGSGSGADCDPCSTQFRDIARRLHGSVVSTVGLDPDNIAAAGVLAAMSIVGPPVAATADAVVKGILDDTIDIADPDVCTMARHYIASRSTLLPVDPNLATRILGPGLTGITLGVQHVVRAAKELDAEDRFSGQPARVRFEALRSSALGLATLASQRVGTGTRMQTAQMVDRFDDGYALLSAGAVEDAVLGADGRGDPTLVIQRLTGQDVRGRFEVAFATLALFLELENEIPDRIEHAGDLLSAAVALEVAWVRAGIGPSQTEPRSELRAVG